MFSTNEILKMIQALEYTQKIFDKNEDSEVTNTILVAKLKKISENIISEEQKLKETLL